METVCDNKKRQYRNFIMLLILAGFAACIIYYIYSLNSLIPNTINLNSNTVSRIDLKVPFVGTVRQQTLSCEEDKYTTAYSEKIVPINVNLLDSVEVRTSESGNYLFDFRLLGFIPIKSVQVNVVDEVLLIPCGIPVGIYIETRGVMVVDIGDIGLTDGSSICPASDLLWPGDYIVSIGEHKVFDKEELIEQINNEENYRNDYVDVGIRRNGNIINVRIKPAVDETGKRRIGTWVRDDCQGLGTLTYIDSAGHFGALGHGISDIDTGKLVDSVYGRLYCAKIWSIIKGKSGVPGEIVGSINYDPSCFLGIIRANSDIGIYGDCAENIYEYVDSYALPVGYKQDINLGKAYVRSFINGKIQDYEINITGINMSNSNLNKGIIFTVTDEELLRNTGGIIQGMSGSPIIQNNRIIGAVTHVLVNDSSKGYGIFIETMLERK